MFQKINAHILILLFVALFSYESFEYFCGLSFEHHETISGILELEEEVILDFETKNYLPEHFNPLKGKYDLDWNSIKLVEMDEEVSLDFDTKDYLPQGFNPYRVMCASQGIL